MGEREGINLYAFVRQNPIRLIDPWGFTFFPSDFIGPLQPGDTRCPDAPPGVSLYQNMLQAHENRFRPLMFGPLLNLNSATWFRGMVEPAGPWDFKVGDYDNAAQYEDFGNFHYGATGSAVGFSPWMLQNEAGIAQQNDPQTKKFGVGSPGTRIKPGSGVSPYGDQPKDNSWIRKGIDYNREYPVQKGPGPCG
jgi:type VI secretion system secreted protein VgrG